MRDDFAPTEPSHQALLSAIAADDPPDTAPVAAAPRSGRRGMPFYGWVVVIAATGVSAVASLLGGMNAGLFIKPMGQSIGISRGDFGWAIAARQVAGAISAPWLGRLADRHGPRWLMVGGAVIACGAVFALGSVSSAWQVVVLFALVGLAGLGNPGSVLITTPVAKWFVRRRASAMAVVSTGVPIGVVIFTPLTAILIGHLGWRHALLVAAVLALVLIVPLALLVRPAPEAMGLRPDGDPAPSDADATVLSADAFEESWTREQALRSPLLWRLIVVFGVVMLAQASIGTHRIAHFADQGISEDLISWGTGLDAFSALIATMVFGRLIRSFDPRYVGAWGMMLMAGGTIFTIFAHSVVTMYASMMVFGGAVGALLTMQNYLWPEYFGRRNIGAIRGISLPFTLVMSATGPVIAGYTYDALGTYDPVWWGGSVLMVLGALLLATSQRPSPPPDDVGNLRHQSGAQS